MSEPAAFFDRWQTDTRKMKESAPQIIKAFGTLFQSLMGEGALSVREKELISVGIALAVQCQPCMNLHVQKALKAGASKEQVLEAAGVAVMMRGGPAYTHVPEVIRVLEHLEASRT